MATAPMTVTTGAVFVPEIWAKDLMKATQSNLVMANLVKRFDGEVSAYGDTIHVGNVSHLTATAVTPGSDVNTQAPTETEVVILVDQHFESSFEIHDRLKFQAKYRLAEEYKAEAGYALAKNIDSALTALYAGLTQYVGSGSVQITDANLLAAKLKLDNADVPRTNRYLVVSPSAESDMLAIDKFVRADAIGSGDAIKNGMIGKLYGMEIYSSTNIVVEDDTTDVVHNLMFHKDAFGLALQKDITVEKNRDPRSLSDIYISQILYGVKELRDDHAVDVRCAV
jgi:N4-gp56 family major capsid protein